LIFNNNNLNNKTMKTKHFLALSLMLVIAIFTLQAQVRIGDLSAPRSGVSLDLNRSNNTAETGFGLPVVQLVNSGSALPLAANFSTLQGVIVYNTTVDPSAGLPYAGIYVAGANNWVRVQMGGETAEYADIVLLTALPATVWLGTDGSESRQLTIATPIDNTENITLYYQWYYVNLGESEIPVAIPDSTAKTFTISAGSDANYQLKNPGEVKKYFCVVRNGTRSVVTTRVRAVYGSGVFLNNDKWLNVLGYNLGATGTTLTPAEQFNKDPGDLTVAGYLYQWGRAEDGHQLRDTASVASSFLYHGVLNATDGVAVNVTSGQPTDDNFKTKFILRSAGTFDWRNHTASNWADTADPCRNLSLGDGKTWRLPTSDEWSQIYNNNYPEHTGKGLRFRPDGTTRIGVFLPAAGHRNRSTGALTNVDMFGYYWSSTANGTNALNLNFSATTVNPTTSSSRSGGFSVRCVAD
jgi:uncharacterized protein (TIGR02145 family)